MTKPDAKALKLATQIVDSLAGDWKPEQYHDTYAEELRTRSSARTRARTSSRRRRAEDEGAKVLDLMEALEQSVAAAKGARGEPRTRKPRAGTKTKAKSRAKTRRAPSGWRPRRGRRRSERRARPPDRSPRPLPGQARLRGHRRAVGHDRPPAAGNRFVVQRHRARAPLRLPPRGRRRAGQLGGAQGADARPRREADGRARRGPPARLLRLRGRHPRRRVRRRRRDRVGLGHLGARPRGDDPRAPSRPATCTSTCTARSCAGRFVLVRRGRQGDKEQWLLLHKHDDHAVDGLGPGGPSPLGEERAHQRRGAGRRRRPRWSSRSLVGRRRPPTSWPRSTRSARPASGRSASTRCASRTSTRCCSRPAGRGGPGAHQARPHPPPRRRWRRRCCRTWPTGR